MLVVMQGTDRGYKQWVKQLEFSRDGTQLYAGITKEHRRKSDLAVICRLNLSAITDQWDVLNTSETHHDIALTEMRCFPKGFGANELLVIDGRWKYAFDKRGEMTWFQHDGESAAGSHASFSHDDRSLLEFRYRTEDAPLVRFRFRDDPPTDEEIRIVDAGWFHNISDQRLFPRSIDSRNSWVILGIQNWLVVGWIENNSFHPSSAYYHTGEFHWTRFSQNGQKILGICGWQVLIWDHLIPAQNEEPTQDEKSAIKLKGHKQMVTDAAFLPDGRLMTSSLDKTVRIWNIETGAQLECYDWHIGPVRSVAVSPDGTIAAAGGSGENQIVIWDLD